MNKLSSSSHILVKYSSKELKYGDKIKFYYALKGRKGDEGVVKFYNARFLGKGVLFVSAKNKKSIIEFFKHWKVPIEIISIDLKSIEKIDFGK